MADRTTHHRVNIYGNNDRLIEVDAATHAINTIDYSHHEIHAGNHYKAGYGVTDQSLDTDDTVVVLFTTPDSTTWAHWTMTASATGFCRVDVYENPTVSAAGTGVTEWNRNRNSTKTATVVVTHTPTTSNNGTLMVRKFLGGEGFKTDFSGEHRGDSEFILKQNEQYLIIATALADNISIQVGGDWYEHADKE